MFPEDYNELSEAENKPQRQYVSSIPHPDSNKLLRENEKLKKSLEKEQFFNKLLDQELKDLKNANGDYTPYDPNAFVQQKGVSKGAFYTVLIIALGLAGYIAYNWNSGYRSSIIQSDNAISAPAAVSGAAAAIKDSVPNIVANNNIPAATVNNIPPPAAKKTIQEQRAEIKAEEAKVALNKPKNVQPPPAVNEPAKETIAIQKETTGKVLPADNATTPNNTNTASTNRAATIAAENEAISQNQPAATTAAPVAENTENRPVIAYYTVTSKANFYTRPDENTMRSAFIAQYNNTKVGALEENNGFIYVVYTNALGYTIKGWLSLKDLTKAAN